MTHLKPKATKAVVAEPQWRFAAFIKRRRRVARSARRTGSSVACVTARVLCSSIDLFRDYFSPGLGIPDQATVDFLHVQ
jgi:hypothetical protein